MKSKDFDTAFDNGEDITHFLDYSTACRPGQTQNQVSIDFPVWMLELVDKEAGRLGVTRQLVIKRWLAERLERGNSDGYGKNIV